MSKPTQTIYKESDRTVIFQMQALTMREAVQAAIDQGISLEGALLSGFDLRGLNGAADFKGAYMVGTVTDGSVFNRGCFDDVVAVGSAHRFTKFREVTAEAADFTNADLSDSDWSDAVVTNIVLVGSTRTRVATSASSVILVD